MRLAFMGTPAFAVPSLEALVDAGYEGPVCLEVIGPEQTMQQAQAIASESYGYMNAILKLLNAR